MMMELTQCTRNLICLLIMFSIVRGEAQVWDWLRYLHRSDAYDSLSISRYRLQKNIKAFEPIDDSKLEITSKHSYYFRDGNMLDSIKSKVGSNEMTKTYFEYDDNNRLTNIQNQYHSVSCNYNPIAHKYIFSHHSKLGDNIRIQEIYLNENDRMKTQFTYDNNQLESANMYKYNDDDRIIWRGSHGQRKGETFFYYENDTLLQEVRLVDNRDLALIKHVYDKHADIESIFAAEPNLGIVYHIFNVGKNEHLITYRRGQNGMMYRDTSIKRQYDHRGNMTRSVVYQSDLVEVKVWKYYYREER